MRGNFVTSLSLRALFDIAGTLTASFAGTYGTSGKTEGKEMSIPLGASVSPRYAGTEAAGTPVDYRRMRIDTHITWVAALEV